MPEWIKNCPTLGIFSARGSNDGSEV